jgi:hypothetical protein
MSAAALAATAYGFGLPDVQALDQAKASGKHHLLLLRCSVE